METKEKSESEEFLYLPPPREASYYVEEGIREKLVRKTKDNPFVPLGIGLTTFALTAGLMQMRKGNKKRSQNMMRLRIFGQGFTVVAVLLGVVYGTRNKQAQTQPQRGHPFQP